MYKKRQLYAGQRITALHSGLLAEDTRLSSTTSQAKYTLETLVGGIALMRISGTVSDQDFDLSNALSSLSKKHPHIILDLTGLIAGTPKFFSFLGDLSARSRIKVIVTAAAVIENCKQIGLQTYPTEKSAALAYAGDETVRMLLAKLRDVPILNTEAYQLISSLAQPDISFPELEARIGNNPGLCSQVIRVANSAYFRRANRVETLQQSLVTLGFSNLRQLFWYNFYNSTTNLFRAQIDVIEHGRKCAKLAEFICRSAGSSGEECSKVRLAALLHDIGRQALAFFFPQQYEKVHTLIHNSGIHSFTAELMVFGTEHQSIGSLLCQKWNFPDYMSGIIADHHYLQASNWNTLTLPVFIANNFLNESQNIPFTSWFQKLEAYFFLKRKDLPWDDVKSEFEQVVAGEVDPF